MTIVVTGLSIRGSRSTWLPSNEAGASSRHLLDDVTGTFASGALTLVIGASGAGKSTLLRAVAGLLPPEAGTVHVDGQPVYRGRKPTREALLQMSYVAQFPEEQLFAGTVKGEVRYSLRPYRLDASEESRRIEAALKAGGIPLALSQASPLTLSGGQKRRLATASSIAPNAPWLIMDEPTAGLDAAAIHRLLSLFAGWKASEQMAGDGDLNNPTPRGGIVIATHHIGPLLRYADSIWMLKNGRLEGIHSVSDVFANPDLLVELGVGVPEELRLMEELRKQGIAVSGIPNAKELATAMLASGRISPVNQQASRFMPAKSPNPSTAQVGHTIVGSSFPVATPEETQASSGSVVDPRAKWWFFACLTVGLFVQNSWLGLGVFALLLVLVIRFVHFRIQSLVRTLSPILWLMGFSVLLSGLTVTFQPSHALSVSVDWLHAETTLRGVCEFALAIGVGGLIPATMTRLEMKKGLELSLGRLSRIGVPVEAVSLSLTLILRFLPLLRQEVSRFSAIASSRAKVPTKPGRLRPSSLPSAVIPLVLSMLRLGEDFASALEARGLRNFRSRGRKPISSRLNRQSVSVILSGGLLFLGLFSLRFL